MATNQIPQIYQLKVTLIDSSPPIWRRLKVSADVSLAQLHNILQVAMGWQDSHLHEFRIGDQTFGRPDWEDSFVGQPLSKDERRVRLKNILRNVGAEMVYAYDFGENWEHQVILETVLAAEAGRRYPSCVDGERRCPPEDCGGMPGYERLLEVLRDRYHDEYIDTVRWLGGGFDPHDFFVDGVNANLALLRPRKKAPPRRLQNPTIS